MVQRVELEVSEKYQPNIEEVVLSSPDVDSYAAHTVLDLVANKPDAILLLPTGNTPKGMYRIIAEESNYGREVDFSKVNVLNLDEYWPISGGHFASFKYYMKHHFYNYVNIPREQRYIADGGYPEPFTETARIQGHLEVFKKKGIDLAVVGIGKNGHLGFNEPGTPHDMETWITELSEDTRRANASDFILPEHLYGIQESIPVPHHAITLGLGENGIRAAKHIMLLAKGEAKAEALRRAFREPSTEEVPASALQNHLNVTIVADYAAAEGLGAA